MRHQDLGYPPEPVPPVAGRPCSTWIALFALSHRETADGWARIAWPDGGPLLTQPWPEVAIFEAIRGELHSIALERIRRQGRRGRRI